MRRVALVAAFRDGLLLLGKRRDSGRWTLPGGHLNEGEEPLEGARRELKEETGLAPDGALKLMDEREIGELKLYTYRCTVAGAPTGKHDPDEECGVWAFFDVSKGVPKDVAENMQGSQDPDKNPVLDEFGLAKAEDPPRTMWYVPAGQKAAQPLHGPHVVRFEDRGADAEGRLTTIHMQDGSKLHTRESVPLLSLRLKTIQSYIDAENLGKVEGSALAKMALIHNDPAQPKTVYRVQDAHGNGPYGFAFGFAGGASKTRPEPFGGPTRDFNSPDKYSFSGGEHLFGFEHPEHARRWFGPKAMANLARQGFTVQPVQASQVYRSESGRQIFFKPHMPHPALAKAEGDEVDRLLLHQDPRERRMALKLHGVDGRHLVRAFHDEDPEVQDLALKHPNVDHAALLGLMQAPGREGLQLRALQHPRADRAHVEALYHTHKARPGPERHGVMRAIGQHPHLDAGLIERMVEDGNGLHVVDNLNTPAHVVNRLIEDHLSDPAHADKRHLARRAVRHAAADPALVARAFKDGPLDVRLAVAQSGNLPEALAHDALVRGQLPGHDHEALLRAAIVDNPQASPRHLAQAAKDRNPLVRQAAAQRLGPHVYKFEAAHTAWLGAQLAKAVPPQDYAGIVRASDPAGRGLVDHKPDLQAHPPEHTADVQAYQHAVLASPEPVKRQTTMKGAGVTPKVVYGLPMTHPTHADVRFMVKPYHERVVKHLAALGEHPHLGWAEMTNQALYHAGGIGQLHQKVHVAEHRMGNDLPAEPALVVKMERGMEPVLAHPVARLATPEVREDARKVALMDFLTGNLDRHGANVLVHRLYGAREDRVDRLLAIDHGRSFQYATDREHKWVKRNRQPRALTDAFKHYVNKSALSEFTGELEDRDPQHQQQAEWTPALDWWGAAAPRVKAAMAQRLDQIQDPEVRKHIERNFAARTRYLDDLAHFGVDNHGEDWHDYQVPVYRPGEITDEEREELGRHAYNSGPLFAR